jgi:putative ABC transport system ATP-binding protein
MMVTHSMTHAAALGDRLVMVHQGRLIFDAEGAAKQRLRPHDLLEKFEELRRSDQLDETAARLLREVYV